MTDWQPGQPIATPDDERAWQAWRTACKLDGQRWRRARLVRIDYMPSPDAQAVIDAKRGHRYPLNTNSGVLDAIVIEWAELTGIKYRQVQEPMSPARRPELPDASRANKSGKRTGVAPGERVTCAAKRRRDGQPCQAKSVPGKRRCKWHGGCSTGPRTIDGKAKALANLAQYHAVRFGPSLERVESIAAAITAIDPVANGF